MTAVGLVIFLIVAAAVRWRETWATWRPFLAGGLGCRSGSRWPRSGTRSRRCCGGPQSDSGLPARMMRDYGADLAAYVAACPASRCWATWTPPAASRRTPRRRTPSSAGRCSPSRSRWWSRCGSAAALGLFAVGLVFAYLSLGPVVRLHGEPTEIPSMWAFLHEVPVLAPRCRPAGRWRSPRSSACCWPWASPAGSARGDAVGSPPSSGAVGAAVLLVALVPIAPTSLLATKLTNTPGFVADGSWARYASGGRSIVFVPRPNLRQQRPDPLVCLHAHPMPLAGGYFLALVGPDRIASFTSEYRPTNYFLRYGQQPSGAGADRGGESRQRLRRPGLLERRCGGAATARHRAVEEGPDYVVRRTAGAGWSATSGCGTSRSYRADRRCTGGRCIASRSGPGAGGSGNGLGRSVRNASRASAKKRGELSGTPAPTRVMIAALAINNRTTSFGVKSARSVPCSCAARISRSGWRTTACVAVETRSTSAG